jgi:hypothetical protein
VADQPGPTYLELMRRIHGANVYGGFMPAMAEDRQGWNSQHPAFEEIIRTSRPDIVIDVGAWKGASTIVLADLLKRHASMGRSSRWIRFWAASSTGTEVLALPDWSRIVLAGRCCMNRF